LVLVLKQKYKSLGLGLVKVQTSARNEYTGTRVNEMVSQHKMHFTFLLLRRPD